MFIFLWILQGLLALHTAIGAAWKLSNPINAVPALSAIPNNVWQGLSIFELACAAALLLPLVNKRFGIFAVLGALGIALEMLAFCGINLSSGAPEYGSIIYWGIVAAIALFIAYRRRRVSL